MPTPIRRCRGWSAVVLWLATVMLLAWSSLTARADPPYYDRPQPQATTDQSPDRNQAATGNDDDPYDDAPLLSDLYDPATAPKIQPGTRYVFPEHESIGGTVVHPDGKRVYAIVQFTAMDVWGLLTLAWPEYVLTLCTIILLWIIIRRWRRPQIKGAQYCRKCNYQLTNLTSNTCPECGRTLTKRMRRQGKRRAPRIALALIILAALGTTYSLTLHRLPRDIWPDDWPHWWSKWLDRAAVANLKYRWIEDRSKIISQIVEIDMVRGVKSRVLDQRTGDASSSMDIRLAISNQRRFLVVGSRFEKTLQFFDLNTDSGQFSINVDNIKPPVGLGASSSMPRGVISGWGDLLYDESTQTVILAMYIPGDGRSRRILAFNPQTMEARWWTDVVPQSDLLDIAFDFESQRLLTFGEFPDPKSLDLIEWQIEKGAINPMPIRRLKIEGPQGDDSMDWAPQWDIHAIALSNNAASLATGLRFGIRIWQLPDSTVIPLHYSPDQVNRPCCWAHDLQVVVLSNLGPLGQAHLLAVSLSEDHVAQRAAEIIPGDSYDYFRFMGLSQDNRSLFVFAAQRMTPMSLLYSHEVLRYDLSPLNP